MAIVMRWLKLPLLAASLPFVAFAGSAAAQEAPVAPRISGPAVHENLSIYFIHGASAPGPVPLTLDEAMKAGAAVVHETGNVSKLAIENTGNEEVFIQAGDIVKGGRQDRVLTVSFVVPARSGRVDIAAYCVEQGRWAARGAEDVKRFASSEKALPLREAKLAMLAPARPRPSNVGERSGLPPDATASASAESTVNRTLRTQRINPEVDGYAGGTNRQAEMWMNVATAQRKLSEKLGQSVAASTSASSLQLALENTRLAEARKAFVEKLENAPNGNADEADIVGFVFAIGGKLSGGEVYASHGLFAKMWKKQLEAAVTEAIAEKGAASPAPLSNGDVQAFLARAATGKSSETLVPSGALVRETREADGALLTETRRQAGPVIHRSYLAF